MFGIKVLSLPLTVLDPAENNGSAERTIAYSYDLGRCFAESAVNSLTVKESIVEVAKSLQHIPGHTDISMDGIANFIFTVYKMISKKSAKPPLARKAERVC